MKKSYTYVDYSTNKKITDLEEISITPSTSDIIKTPDGFDGYNKVTVNAVTSHIDSNIQAKNIKKDVQILGVTGIYDNRYPEVAITINPRTRKQTIVPDSGKTISSVTVNAVTSSIDSNIKAENIKKDINILGVTGTLENGITPTGTIDITENGEYDVTNYASANVNVGSSPSITYTGHADSVGLAAIGWTQDDIDYYQENGVNWNEEDDDYHKVPDFNIALYGVIDENNISS